MAANTKTHTFVAKNTDMSATLDMFKITFSKDYAMIQASNLYNVIDYDNNDKITSQTGMIGRWSYFLSKDMKIKMSANDSIFTFHYDSDGTFTITKS
jgi:hypothetical protein